MKKLHRCAMNGIDELSDDVSEYRSRVILNPSLRVNSAERREESREYSLGLPSPSGFFGRPSAAGRRGDLR